MAPKHFRKDVQYYKFCLYGFLKNQRFFEPYFLLILHFEKGLNLTQFGVLLSIRFILRAFLEIPSGFIADALGRRGSMLFSYACYIISFAAYYFAESFIMLIIPSILFSIGDAFRTGTHKAMIFEYLKIKGWENAKTAYYGRTRAWSQTGSAISAIIATAIIWFRTDYNIVFLYSLIPYCLGFVFLASYPKNLEGKTNTHVPLSNIFNEINKTVLESFKEFRKQSKLRLSLSVASFTGFYFAVKEYLQLVIIALVAVLPSVSSLPWENDKKEKIMLGIVYTGLYFITATASLNTQSLSARFKNVSIYLNFLLLSGIIVGVAGGISFQLNYLFPALIMFILIYIIQNLRKPASTAVIADNFDHKIHASALSIEAQLSSIIGAGLGLSLGFLADRLEPGNSLIIVSVFMLILFPIFKLKPSKTKK